MSQSVLPLLTIISGLQQARKGFEIFPNILPSKFLKKQ
jgi:hypothetical protein